MLYLVRHAESGRDAQEGRRGQRADVRAAILALDPEARIEESTGRLLVASEHDLAPGLRTVHGVVSFSSCTHARSDSKADRSSCACDVEAPSNAKRSRVPSRATHAGRWSSRRPSVR